MKKILCLLMTAALVLTFAGCEERTANSPALSPESASEPVEMPTTVTPPDTMTIDALLSIVNSASDFEEGYAFDKSDADVFDVPASPQDDETHYIFEREDIEVALILSKVKNCFIGAYFRSLLDDEVTEDDMASYARAFLMALEPNEYKNMIESVVPVENVGDDYAGMCSGECWNVTYHKDLINIMPKGTA